MRENITVASTYRHCGVVLLQLNVGAQNYPSRAGLIFTVLLVFSTVGKFS
jgi:hypothetical protein